MRKVLVLATVVAMGIPAMARDVALTPVQDVGLYPLVKSGNANRGLGGRMDIGGAVEDDSALMQFDFSGVPLGVGEFVQSASLEFFCAKSGMCYVLDMVAYPLAAPFVQGGGSNPVNDPVAGSTNYPWGPCAVGDATWLYSAVTEVVADSDFGMVVSAGVPWDIPGGRGIGTDVLDQRMIDQKLAGIPGAGQTYQESLGSVDFTAVGVQVLQDWILGNQDNYGMSIWDANPSGVPIRAATCEHPIAALRPTLTLTIVPEPGILAVLAIGGAALIGRRRK